MNLKTVTLVAGITQLLAMGGGIFNYIQFAPKLKWADNGAWFVTEPLFVVAQIMMAVFLFVLFARQKSK
jgi:ribose/xylose/arabinose/galactoside ABC-type transport system permease subunit